MKQIDKDLLVKYLYNLSINIDFHNNYSKINDYDLLEENETSYNVYDLSILNTLLKINNKLQQYNLNLNKYFQYQTTNNNFENHFLNIYDLKNGINSKFCAYKDTEIETTDTVIYALKDNKIYVAAIIRKNAPDRGKIALPGGIVEINENSQDSAIRESQEETSLNKILKVEFLGKVKSNLWDSRFSKKTTISGYSILTDYDSLINLEAKDDALKINIYEIEELLNKDMAFLHKYWVLKLSEMLNINSINTKKINQELKNLKYYILCDKLISNEIRENLYNKYIFNKLCVSNEEHLFDEIRENLYNKYKFN